MGLHPSNAFACAVDFLFRIRPEALEPHLPVGFRGTAVPRSPTHLFKSPAAPSASCSACAPRRWSPICR
jgi:hypothetical protein